MLLSAQKHGFCAAFLFPFTFFDKYATMTAMTAEEAMAMERHYNAFISYRHHPDDIRVATEIHRSLEHFRIPKALRNKNDGPFRLFRDKEELPASSNLSDDIAAALKNSDYLIVICSVHTKESVWVQREIEMFLQTHDRGKVLTVLAGGEPYEVIPEILLHDEKTDPVTGEVTLVDREPLSCDWRLSRRQAKTEELPRLAAALLGCPYDELRQRQRQYRMRRLITVFSAALVASLCLTAYFVYTTLTIRDANEKIQQANVRIQENLDEALKNQSMHLATAAAERMEAGDRLTAVALAMAALPSEENERPYVPEAEAVLADALGVYAAEPKVVAVGAMDIGANAEVSEFRVTASGKVVYLFDRRDMMTAWDAATMQQLSAVSVQVSSTETVLTTAQDNVVLRNSDSTLWCYSPKGACLWQAEDCRDAAISPDGNTVLVLTADDQILFLNAENGEQTRDPLTVEPLDITDGIFWFLADTCATDQPIPLRYSGADDYDLLTVDPASGKQTVLARGERLPSHAYQENGKLFVMTNDGSGMFAGFMMDMRTTEKMNYDVVCYDATSGTRLWKSSMPCYLYTGFFLMERIPETEQLLCAVGDRFRIVDINTGETIAECEAGSGILAVKVGKGSASAVVQDGWFCSYNYATNQCHELKIMKENLQQADINSGCFTLERFSTQVTVYRSVEGEPSWTVESESGFYNGGYQVCDNMIAVDSYPYVYLFDTEKKEIRWKADRGGDLLGFTSDGKELWAGSSYDGLSAYNTQTGEFVTTDIPDDPENEWAMSAGNVMMAQDKLYYPVNSDGDLRLLCWSPEEEKPTASVTIGKDVIATEEYWRVKSVTVKENMIWIQLSTGALFEADTATGSVRRLTDNATESAVFAFREDSDEFAVAFGNELWLSRFGKEPHLYIHTQAIPGALYFFGDELLALCDDGAVYRYDATGTQLSRTMLSVYSSFSGQLVDGGDVEWFVTDDNELIVNACGMGNILDTDSFRLSAEIEDFVLYSPRENVLFCLPNEGLKAFKRYTVDELLAIGKEQLGSFELSETKRNAYGID